MSEKLKACPDWVTSRCKFKCKERDGHEWYVRIDSKGMHFTCFFCGKEEFEPNEKCSSQAENKEGE